MRPNEQPRTLPHQQEPDPASPRRPRAARHRGDDLRRSGRAGSSLISARGDGAMDRRVSTVDGDVPAAGRDHPQRARSGMTAPKSSTHGDLQVPQPLHELEAEVMEEIWERGEASVREGMEALNAGADKERAYTTYMTIMARLDSKGLLERRRQGKTDFYTPRYARNQ